MLICLMDSLLIYQSMFLYLLQELSDDFIGLSTVKIGVGTPGDGIDPEDIFVGIGVTIKQSKFNIFYWYWNWCAS